MTAALTAARARWRQGGQLRRWIVRGAVLALLVGGLTLVAAPAWAWPFDACKSPPIPTAPRGGLAGYIDPSVLHEPSGPSGGIDPYGQYGYGGMVWATYDTGCVVGDPGAEVDTMFGNFFLELAVVAFASQMATTGLLADDTLPTAVGEAATKSGVSFYDVVFSPWAGAAVAVSAAVMLVATTRGETSKVLTRAALVVAAVAIAALSFGSGGQLSRELSGTLRGALADLNAGIARTFPADAANPEYGMRNVLYRELLWRAWKDGEVGPDGREDLAWGLFREQALTRAEAAQLAAGDGAAEEQLFEAKGERWMALADDARPSEYRTIQGGGSSRTGAALVALLKLAPIALLQVFCGLTLYMMYAFLALLPVGAPILGLFSLVAPGLPEKSVRVIGNVVAGGVAAALATLVHTVVVLHLSSGDLGAWPTIVFIWVSSYILWKLIQPLVSLTSILAAALGSQRVHAPHLFGRALLLAALLRGRGRGRGRHQADDGAGWWPSAPPGSGPTGLGGGPSGGPPGGPSGGGPRGPRPETRPGGGGWLVPRPVGMPGGGGGGGGPGGGPRRYWRIDVERPGGTADVVAAEAVLAAAPTGDTVTTGSPSRNLPARRDAGPSFAQSDAAAHEHASYYRPGADPVAHERAGYYRPGAEGRSARPDLRPAEAGSPVYRITGLYAPPPRRRPIPPSPRPITSSAGPTSRPPRPELRGGRP
jgi:hypothetical protein